MTALRSESNHSDEKTFTKSHRNTLVIKAWLNSATSSNSENKFRSPMKNRLRNIDTGTKLFQSCCKMIHCKPSFCSEVVPTTLQVCNCSKRLLHCLNRSSSTPQLVPHPCLSWLPPCQLTLPPELKIQRYTWLPWFT